MGWWGLDRSGSGEGPVEGSYEVGNEPSGSMKRWEVLEWLHNWQLLKKASAPSTYVLVFPVVSFLLDFPPISYMHSSSPT
jgi:hypothetical protein